MELSPTQWGAQVDYDAWTDRYTPDDKIIIHYGGGSAYKTNDLASEARVLRIFEDVHLRKGWRGLAYGWAIGNSGTVYRGRGFNSYGAHTGDLDRDGISENSEGIPIVFILGVGETPSKAALASFANLRAVTLEPKAGRTLPVYGHREIAEMGTGTITTCPGFALMGEIYDERQFGIRIGTQGETMASYAELVNTHSADELPDWSLDTTAAYIAAGGTTVPKSMTRPAFRFDLAWFWDKFVEPLRTLLNSLAVRVKNLETNDAAQVKTNGKLATEIAGLNARVAELESRPVASGSLAGSYEATITIK